MNVPSSLALKCFLVAIAGPFAVGCKAPHSIADPIDLVGSFALVAVDGKPVPASVLHDGGTLEVLSGAFTFSPEGTCSATTVFIAPSGGEVSREASATYQRDGARLTMRWKDAGRTVGMLDGDTFTMINEGMSFEYRR